VNRPQHVTPRPCPNCGRPTIPGQLERHGACPQCTAARARDAIMHAYRGDPFAHDDEGHE